jgi:hypothetical protein
MTGHTFYPIFIEGALQPATLSYFGRITASYSIIFWINFLKSLSITLISTTPAVTSYHSSLGLPRSLFPTKFPINTPTTEILTAPPQNKTDNTVYIFCVILAKRRQN